MRTAARRDVTEPAIIAALQKAGCQVQQLSAKDIPDLLVCLPEWMDNRMALVECKTGRGKLRPGQVAFFETWRGLKIKANTPESALAQLGLMESSKDE